MRVFLGGTCNETQWRSVVIKDLDAIGVDYFNPVVDDWDEAAKETELFEREHCDICLFVITPKMMGVYSIAEVVDDSNKRPQRTIFCVLEKDEGLCFDTGQWRSLQAVMSLVKRNGVYVATDLTATIQGIHKKSLLYDR